MAATAAVIFTGVSAFASASGAFAQAEGAQRRARYKARIQERNAEIALQDAESIRERGREAEARHRDRIEQTIGAARATGAGSGFVVDEGVSAELQGDLRFAGEMDILNMRDEIELRVRRKKIEAQNATLQGNLLEAEADSIDPGAIGLTTLLSGAANTASVAQSTGAFD